MLRCSMPADRLFHQAARIRMSSENKYREADFSSKLKNIFVELHGYSYYHSPSDMKLSDRRFIGRKKIIEKQKMHLEEILEAEKGHIQWAYNLQEIPAGMYLLTIQVGTSTQTQKIIIKEWLYYNLF